MKTRLLPNPLPSIAFIVLAIALVQVTWAGEPAGKIEQRLSPEQLHETGLDTLTPAQLARLNELLQQQASADRDTPLPRTGVERGGSSYLGMDEKPITTRLKGEISQWQPGTEFALENGQVWKVLKGSMKLRKPMQSPEVVLVPGIAGRWFLQVDEDLPKARVYRID